MIYISWDIEYDRLKLVIIGQFLPLFSPKTQKSIIFKKLKNIIILHMYTENHNHMMYDSWDMECDRHNFLSFGAIFALLPHYWSRKMKLWKNVKNTLRYYSFTHMYHNLWLYLILTKQSGNIEQNPGPKSKSSQNLSLLFGTGNLIASLRIILSKYSF